MDKRMPWPYDGLTQKEIEMDKDHLERTLDEINRQLTDINVMLVDLTEWKQEIEAALSDVQSSGMLGMVGKLLGK